jgi:uncharacterized protein YdhG (YjbR/CyaY superfamily)
MYKLFAMSLSTRKTPKTIDEYIDLQTSPAQEKLKQLRQLIKKTIPEAEETISYQMPALKFHGLLVWYAAAKNHYALYPMAEVLEVFKDKLTDYQTSKGTIRFDYDTPMPVDLIQEIVAYRVKQNLSKALAMKAAKKKKP